MLRASTQVRLPLFARVAASAAALPQHLTVHGACALLILRLWQARRGLARNAAHRFHRDLHSGARKARSPVRTSKHHVRV